MVKPHRPPTEETAVAPTVPDWHCPIVGEELTPGTYDLRLCVIKDNGATFTTARVILHKPTTVAQLDETMTTNYDYLTRVISVRQILGRMVILPLADYIALKNLAREASAAGGWAATRLLDRIEREHG
jgi:hypothetical protein